MCRPKDILTQLIALLLFFTAPEDGAQSPEQATKGPDSETLSVPRYELFPGTTAALFLHLVCIYCT